MSDLEGKPPVLGSWRRLYAVVIGALVLYIAVGALVTWVYAP